MGGGGGGGGGGGDQGVNLTSYLDSSHKVSQYLGYFMTPVLPIGGDPGVNLTSYLDSSLLPPNTFYGSKCNT